MQKDLITKKAFQEDLLSWYAKNARVLPWRLSPEAVSAGHKPDPYHVWLSEIMLQQTTVAAVKTYFEAFITRWPNLEALAKAEDQAVMQAWAGLGYYARCRNLLKCARLIVSAYDGQFPDNEKTLKTLPGIGDYTAAAIAAIAFQKAANVVDGNVERVMSRLYAVQTPLPDAKPLIKGKAAFLAAGLPHENKAGDYAQALMDLGAMICTPRAPSCSVCPVCVHCVAYHQGCMADLPRKKPKTVKPVRGGYVYALYDLTQKKYAVEIRPSKGLLAGMPAFPSSEWVAVASFSKAEAIQQFLEKYAPADQKNIWQNVIKCPVTINKADQYVRHVFTHFSLVLCPIILSIPSAQKIEASSFLWYSREELEKIGFPTVFQKVLKAVEFE